jgi:peroxiredoxin
MKFSPICFLLLFFMLNACNFNSEVGTTYLGGEIINPRENFVLLYKDDVLLDSIHLNKKNRFSYKFKNFTSGLYYFKHTEYQYVFIEPQDSIMLRLNTIDFDESLTFSGKGAHKNNFLINTFLTNEAHTAKSESLFKNSPAKFSNLISNDLNARLKSLDDYNDRYQFSNDFINIAQLHIKFHYYKLKERYPFRNSKLSKSINKKIFYNYREVIDFEDNNLGSFYPYYDYLYSLIKNISLDKKTYNHHKNINNYTTEVVVIDSLFKSKKLKNQLLKNTTLDYLKNIKCEKEANLIFNKFQEFNSNVDNKDKITKLVHTIECLSVGKKLPEFNVVDKLDKTISFKSTLKNKPSVLYFWSSDHPRHIKGVQNKIERYKNNDKYNFIGICLDYDSEKIKPYSKMFNFNYDYSLENPMKTRKELLIQNINKIYVIDTDTKILSSNLNIFDPQFDSKLTLLNKNLNKANL